MSDTIKEYKIDSIEALKDGTIKESKHSLVRKVHLKEKKEGVYYTMKTFRPLDVPDSLKKTITEESKAYSSDLRHPNLVTVRGICYEAGGTRDNVKVDPQVSLLYDFCEHSLASLRVAGDEKVFTPYIRYRIAMEIASGISFLHSHNHHHATLKPENILITKDLHVKITDYAYAVIKNEAASTSKLGSTGGGIAVHNAAYAAPESIKFGAKTFQAQSKADVYAYGLLLFELATLTPPWEGKTETEIRSHLKNTEGNHHPPIPDNVKDEWRSLILSCVERDPSKRPTMKEVFEKDSLFTPAPDLIALFNEYRSNHAPVSPYLVKEISRGLLSKDEDIVIAALKEIEDSCEHSPDDAVRLVNSLLQSHVPEHKDEKKEEKKDEKDEKKEDKPSLGEYLLRTYGKNEKITAALLTALYSVAMHVTKKDKEWMGNSLDSLFAIVTTHINVQPILISAFKLMGLIGILAEVLKNLKFANPDYYNVILTVLKTHSETPVVLGKVMDLLSSLVTDASCRDLMKGSLLEPLQEMHKAGKFANVPANGAKPHIVIDKLAK